MSKRKKMIIRSLRWRAEDAWWHDRQKRKLESDCNLLKGHLDLTVYLPVGSEPGKYEVQVVREPSQPVWSAQGDVSLVD